MRKSLRLFAIFHLAFSLLASAQTHPPKHEFRGAWIATVGNLDWPSSPLLTPEAQRQELTRILDELREAGINAVMFQIRPECDALYASSFDPWSRWLTGSQGVAPSPFYDPLEFAVQAAHARGMELHAWLNPYRAVREIGGYAISPNHVTVQHPEWILTFSRINQKYLNPGLPEVRAYVTAVIMEIVKRYEVDGIHFDDYFYPYPDDNRGFPGITIEDAATFANYARGFTNLGDWRRDNVNLLIATIHDSIQTVKPQVKFGMSPFGIWKNGVPSGVTGLDAYNAIYCDAIAWLSRQIIDYITPQLYWPFGGAQDYGKLMPWWATQTYGRHFYTGQAAYRAANWAADEIPRQIRANRGNATVRGSVFFRALNLRENAKGVTDSLKTNYFRHPSLSPVMAWKDQLAPNAPQNPRYKRIAGTGTAGLVWDLPLTAADGDTAWRYVIYGFAFPGIQPGDLDDPANILEMTGKRLSRPAVSQNVGAARYFVVTALDRNSNESLMSEVLAVTPPATPVLASPAEGASEQAPDATLSWFYPERGAAYHLQVAIDSAFTSALLVNDPGLQDTFRVVTELKAQAVYYWRVRASNPAGAGAWSESRRFETGVAAAVAEARTLARPPVLSQNYPNPFNPITTIMIELPERGLAQLSVIDLLGREVAVLVNEPLKAGRHEIQFDASALPSGTYLYRLRFGSEVITRRMLVVK